MVCKCKSKNRDAGDKEGANKTRTLIFYVQYVPRKGFGSAVWDTIYTIYLSLCTQTADK